MQTANAGKTPVGGEASRAPSATSPYHVSQVINIQSTNPRNTRRHQTLHTFIPIGIGMSDARSVSAHAGMQRYGSRHHETNTLTTMMKRAGDVKYIDVLRMDVEGVEFPILDYLVQSGEITKIGQLLLEIHVRMDSLATSMRYASHVLVQKLSNHMDLFHVAKNGHGGNVYEIGFIAKAKK